MLESWLGLPVIVPDNPELVVARGPALLAQQMQQPPLAVAAVPPRPLSSINRTARASLASRPIKPPQISDGQIPSGRIRVDEPTMGMVRGRKKGRAQ
uniref:hypothetical protein n=1 Tax=Rhodococcus marinonascens TaxID=38311 RepID=UPI000A9DCB07|nr:hypothetical protein [Rhodococcus marinonascens]